MMNNGTEENVQGIQKENQEKEDDTRKNTFSSPTQVEMEEKATDFQKDDQERKESSENNTENYPSAANLEAEKLDVQKEDQVELPGEMKSLNIRGEDNEVDNEKARDELHEKMGDSVELEPKSPVGIKKNLEEILYEEEEPVFDGTEVPGMEADKTSSNHSADHDLDTGSAWPEKAVALKNFVRVKSVVAVSTFMRRLSRNSDDGQNVPDEENEPQRVSHRPVERSVWNPLSLIGISSDVDADSQVEQKFIEAVQPIAMKGRIILYTRLGCHSCREARLFLHQKRLRYVEINIDVYPSRKLELEKIAGSSNVPRVFFNEVLLGGLSELKCLDETGKLDEKIEYVVTEGPSFEAPLPPLSGEDDVSSTGGIDELALIVKKMKECTVVKDRFYKMRRFTNTFLGSEAVDFLSEDQYLEREEVSCLFTFNLGDLGPNCCIT